MQQSSTFYLCNYILERKTYKKLSTYNIVFLLSKSIFLRDKRLARPDELSWKIRAETRVVVSVKCPKFSPILLKLGTWWAKQSLVTYFRITFH